MNECGSIRLAHPLACLLACLLACNGNETPKPEMAAPLQTAPAQTASDKPAASATTATTEAAPTLLMRVVRSEGGVGLRVINAGKGTVSLSPRVTMEELRGTHSVVVPNQTLTLQLTCKSTGCVSLAPGAEIDGPAWLEQVAGQRCGALLMPPSAGRYRLRVETCQGTQQRELEFAWPVE